jgi:SlyX protein
MDPLIDIQTRLTYQEDDIKHLNQIIASQGQQLSALSSEIDRLKQLIKQLAPTLVEDAGDEPPPHY